MSARDDIAALLFTTDNSKAVAPWSEWEHSKKEPRLTEYVYAMADAILAAGYSKPRTITTVKEMDALPVGSVVVDRDGMALQKTNFNFSGTGWNAANGTRDIEPDELERDCFPATVIHEGVSK